MTYRILTWYSEYVLPDPDPVGLGGLGGGAEGGAHLVLQDQVRPGYPATLAGTLLDR